MLETSPPDLTAIQIEETKKFGTHIKQKIENKQDCTGAAEIVSPLLYNGSPNIFWHSAVISLIICLSAKADASMYSNLESLIKLFLVFIKNGIVKTYFPNIGLIGIIEFESC